MKVLNKFLSVTASAALLCTVISSSVYALQESDTVHIVVENNTFSESDGAVWSGTLIDEWVTLNENDSAVSVLDTTLSSHGYTQTGAADNYITDINGLSAAADTAKMGGWMIGYNDWYGNGGINTLNLSDGDEITLSYSLNWGADLGSDFYSTDTSLKSLTVGEENIQLTDNITEYNITLPEGTDSIKVVPTAANKNYLRKIYKNAYTPDTEGTDYKSSRDIQVKNGDVIYIGVGHSAWLSYPPEGLKETLYTLNLEIENAQSDPAEKTDTETDPHTSKPDETNDNPQENIPSYNPDISTEDIIESTSAKLNKPEIFTETGNEWAILALARLGQVDDTSAEQYAETLYDYLEENKSNKATDYAKYIIVLGALGYNAENFNGMNLVSELSDLDFAVKQGINGAAYTLIALDTHNYMIPDAPEGAVQTTRENLIDFILSTQLSDGGWAFFGETSEPDMTGIVIQALAPYYNKDEKVKTAVDKALALLSEIQNDDGTYTSYGAPNCENSAQIVTALSALGIDSASDSRFVKENGNALAGLMRFYIDGSFSHELGGEENALSTLQAFYSVCAYQRFAEAKTVLYDMSDVVFRKSEPVIDPDDEISDNKNEKTDDPTESSVPSSDDKKPTESSESNKNDNGTVPTGENNYMLIIIGSVIAASAVITVLCGKRNFIKNKNEKMDLR